MTVLQPRSGQPRTGESVDLTNCDREPIHLLGHIQPVGFLVAVSMDWMIQHVSANIGDYCLGADAETLPGEPLSTLLPPAAVQAIRGRLQVLVSSDSTERIFGCDVIGRDRPFDVAVHVSGQSIIIEAEPSRVGEQAVIPGAMLKTVIAKIQQTAGLEPLFRECVRQLKGITGFDRVMLYRFADTGAGAVVAEAARGGLESYLGLHYPAADIPVQARALYIRNLTRGIWDVAATPVPIVPPLSPEGQPIDLSLSALRSVSPIHVEYLGNMGVGASFSISIVIDGQLWGLFALHHYAPRHLSMELRAATETFGQMMALVIDARVHAERRAAEERARALHDGLIGRMVASTGSMAAIADYADDLMGIIACDGLTVLSDGEERSFGQTPGPDELTGLARFLNRAAASRVYASDELGAVHPPARDYVAIAAGVLAIPISRSPRDYILFFRRELVQTVTWAGDPTAKDVATGRNGPRLTPRKSFAAWQETVDGKSGAWTESDRKAAEALRISVLEVLLRFGEETDRQRNLSAQRQELLIAELNHRVRNVLGLMRALVAQSRPNASSIDDFAKIISGRIQALARAHDQITSDTASTISLRQIVETEVKAFIGGKASRVHLVGPDIHIEGKAFSTLALVFHEMVTNSAKYGALSDSHGSIRVDWRIDEDGCCRIGWAESGGPPVQPPNRRGFGSTIIERAIPHDLEGSAELFYRLAGLQAEFMLPRGVFTLISKESSGMSLAPPLPASASSTSAGQSFAGLQCLIVEDNMIIALDAEQLLLDRGAARVHLAASVAEARKLIDVESIDIALLDVNLGRETSFPLIPDLNAKGVAYVFVTGYGERVELPAEARGATTVKKPFAHDKLIAAIDDALAARAQGRE